MYKMAETIYKMAETIYKMAETIYKMAETIHKTIIETFYTTIPWDKVSQAPIRPELPNLGIVPHGRWPSIPKLFWNLTTRTL